MMISRSGDILEILISMYLSIFIIYNINICIYLFYFLLKYVRYASYQHNTTDTNKVRHVKLSEV